MNSVSSKAWSRSIEGRIWEDGLHSLENLPRVIDVEIVQLVHTLETAPAALA